MAKGYWIARVDVHNDEGYKAYASADPAIFKKFGGRFVVHRGKFKRRKAVRSRNVVIKFPDYARGARLLPLAGIPGQYQSAADRMRRPISSSSKALSTTAAVSCSFLPACGEVGDKSLPARLKNRERPLALRFASTFLS